VKMLEIGAVCGRTVRMAVFKMFLIIVCVRRLQSMSCFRPIHVEWFVLLIFSLLFQSCGCFCVWRKNKN